MSYCNSILVGELTLRANGVPASGSTDQSQLSMRVTVMGGWERPLDTIYRQSSLMPRSQLIDNSLENPTLSLLSQAHSMVVILSTCTVREQICKDIMVCTLTIE